MQHDIAALVQDRDDGRVGLHGRGIIEHDEVGALSSQLGQGSCPMFLGLQGETHDQLSGPPRGERRQDIRAFFELDGQWITRFCQFLLGPASRAIVAGSRRGDEAVRLREILLRQPVACPRS